MLGIVACVCYFVGRFGAAGNTESYDASIGMYDTCVAHDGCLGVYIISSRSVFVQTQVHRDIALVYLPPHCRTYVSDQKLTSASVTTNRGSI